MGSLKFFPLAAIKQRFNTPVFIETGLGRGDGVIYAQTVDFSNIISIEIMKEQVDAFGPQFSADSRVEIICDTSLNGLKTVFDRAWQRNDTRNMLLWLDAHFAGADVGLRGFGDEKNEDLRLPLITELELIRDKRAALGFKDVILMDDLMIFDDETHYPSEGWKKELDIRPRKHVNAKNQILSILSGTHAHQVFMEDSGFVMIYPR